MSSIFSKIIEGSIPCHKVAEEEHFMAFLDINPLHEGHTLVIPKRETDYIFDIPAEEYENLWTFTKKVAHAIGKAIPCKKVGVAVVGLEVPHAHIHLVPINEVADIDFSRPKLQLSSEALKETAAHIRAHV